MATKTIHIDGTRAYQLLKKAVERKGEDYVTPLVEVAVSNGGVRKVRTRYTHNGKSLCVVGHALSIAGVTQAEMDVQASASDLPERLPRVKFSGVATDVLNEAQIVADEGGTWGEALAEAYKHAPVAYEER